MVQQTSFNVESSRRGKLIWLVFWESNASHSSEGEKDISRRREMKYRNNISTEGLISWSRQRRALSKNSIWKNIIAVNRISSKPSFHLVETYIWVEQFEGNLGLDSQKWRTEDRVIARTGNVQFDESYFFFVGHHLQILFSNFHDELIGTTLKFSATFFKPRNVENIGNTYINQFSWNDQTWQITSSEPWKNWLEEQIYHEVQNKWLLL